MARSGDLLKVRQLGAKDIRVADGRMSYSRGNPYLGFAIANSAMVVALYVGRRVILGPGVQTAGDLVRMRLDQIDMAP